MVETRSKISVIIPTFNSWETLKSCIASIQKQTLKPLEIIIVDNASIDGTSEKVRKGFPQIEIVRLKENTGVTGGRNAGIKVVNRKTDYLFFFDHDMVANEKMLEELVKVAESNPKIGIVTPKIYYFEDKKRIWAAGTEINLWTGQVLFRGGKDRGQYNKIADVQVAPAAMLVRKEMIDKIGRFDDIYFATYEDTDFCFRARKAGYRVVYIPKAITYHKIPLRERESVERLLSRAYWVGRNRMIFMKRYGKNFWLFLLFLPVFTLYYGFLALRFKKISGMVDFLRGTLSGFLLILKGKV